MSNLLSQLREPFTGEQLFDHLPDIVFFIKNRKGQYQVVNQTLVERFNLQEKSQLINKTPSEIQGVRYGQGHEAQDQLVLNQGKTLLNQLEKHAYAGGYYGWCLTRKLPLWGISGEIIGLVGVSQDLRIPDMSGDDYEAISVAIDYAEENICQPPTIDDLAHVAQMSIYQLDRRMKRVFGLTTGQWLIKIRLNQAERQLIETDLPIVSIALNSGYADQSAFTRQFKRTTGMTPSEVRAIQPPLCKN
ncbi:AraC family transcriptional regulator [Alteromonadaceae bacterium M269]|nr:AraC family transcriptional regulator [Alteromonadaceae bacterium M269]